MSAKNALVSSCTTGASNSTAIRLGKAMRPLKMSDIFQTISRSRMAPKATKSVKTSLKGMTDRVPRRYSMHFSP